MPVFSARAIVLDVISDPVAVSVMEDRDTIVAEMVNRFPEVPLDQIRAHVNLVRQFSSFESAARRCENALVCSTGNLE